MDPNVAAKASRDPMLGRTIADKFRIESRVGRGAMGAVYRATQLNLKKRIAIKVMHPEKKDATYSSRFKREAKAASRMDHPNLMRVIDFGEEPDGLLYIAMEYLEGRDLLRVLREEYPLDTARMVSEGRRQADNAVRFLRAEFAPVFANARIRAYGNPGLRQTRWITGRRQLTLEAIRKGDRPADAAARCAWWVELHNARELVHWERFAPGHVYYIPLGCMIPGEADNIVAAGRCVDADVEALSAIRVMGPCIAMGAAAAHALDLAGSNAVHQIDLAQFQRRLTDNLDRTD